MNAPKHRGAATAFADRVFARAGYEDCALHPRTENEAAELRRVNADLRREIELTHDEARAARIERDDARSALADMLARFRALETQLSKNRGT